MSGAAARGLSLAKIKKIIVTFSCYDHRTTAVREVYRHLSCDRLKESNPKCPVIPNILSVPSEPQVEVTFSDDSVLNFKTADMKAIEIISNINQKTKSI